MFGSAWCLVTVQIQFSLMKRTGRPGHSLIPPRPITSQFCLSSPPPSKWTSYVYHSLNCLLTRSLPERFFLTLPEMPMTSNSSFRWLWFFLCFYFTSYFRPDFREFCDFSNIFASSIKVFLVVTFWRCEKYCMRSRKIKHRFSRIISRICQHLKL